MNLARTTVPRPIATSMFFLCILLLGAVAFSRLPVDLLPDVSMPSLSVRTSYENVGPEEIEQLVTRPIERAVAAIEGVEEIRSESGEGSSNVRISFVWGTDLNAAADDIRAALDRLRDNLPEEADAPQVFKFDFSAFPILFLGVASDLEMSALLEFVEDRIKYRIERVAGVASTDVRGARNTEIHVKLDLRKIQAFRLTPEQVLGAIRRDNVNAPAGLVREGRREILVRTEGEFRTPDEIAETIVVQRGGNPIRVRDVAQVRRDLADDRSVVRIDGRPSVMLMVTKQSGANTVDVARAVHGEIEKINAEYPQLEIKTVMDSSTFIEDSIANVRFTGLIGAVLALVILLVFLGDFRSTLVVGTAIPLSIVATFVLIYFGGLTLNVMTFGGLALGIGMLVDNSIVVLENVYRRRQGGEPARRAAIEGAGEVTLAITASTMTTLAVFLPLIFITGMAGVMFKQLAAVVAFSLVCSLVCAAAVVPMLCAIVYRQAGTAKQAPAWQRFVEGEYRRALVFSLDHPVLVSLVFIALFAGSLAALPHVGVELMPEMDEGQVRISVEGQVGSHVDEISGALARVERIIEESVPERESYFVRGGSSGWRVSGSHTGQARINLRPALARTRSSGQIAAVMRKATAGIPGFTFRVRTSSGNFLLRRATSGDGDKISVDIRGFDLTEGARLADEAAAAMRKVEGITDVRVSRDEGRPELVMQVDRRRASTLGLSVRAIGDAVETLVAGSTASRFRERGEEYDIVVRLDERHRNSLEKLVDYSMVTPSGERVYLRDVLRYVRRQGPVSIERADQQRIITISADFAGRDLGSVARDVQAALGTIPVPKGFEIHMGGEVEEQRESFSELLLGLVLAISLVYMVMAAQFESLRAPFVVMFSMPMALVGVVAILLLTDTPLSVNGFMGVIMLAGIVVNNAIVLVDAVGTTRREMAGASFRHALVEAGARRLRPVLMTTMTTVLAMLPLALGRGQGSEMQAPLALVVIGGLLSSTLITLVFIPMAYELVVGEGAADEDDEGMPAAEPVA